MKITEPPIISKYIYDPYTMISFKPDYKRFKIDSLNNDMIDIIRRRACEIAACANMSAPLFTSFNKKIFHFNNFKEFIETHVNDQHVISEVINDRWEIGVCLNDTFDQVSFINGIRTLKGGKHIDYILNMID